MEANKKIVECPFCAEDIEEGLEICPMCDEKLVIKEESKLKKIWGVAVGIVCLLLYIAIEAGLLDTTFDNFGESVGTALENLIETLSTSQTDESQTPETIATAKTEETTKYSDNATADIESPSLPSGECYRWAPADVDICDTEIETDCGIGNIYLDENGVVILSEDCVDSPTTYYIGTYSAKNEEYHFRFTQYCNSHRKEITPLDEDWLVVLEPLNCIDWAYKWENDNHIFVCKPLEATYFINEIKRIFK
ncbi:hypothetical protein AGMMS49965_00730 [Bacteroidia bacterium]|nr:hypothetical protein AGMMS49965_00730 [Bacteroidia bacterium]